MTTVRATRALLGLGVVALLTWGMLWHQWVPLTADGHNCGARVYSFGPGMSFRASEGNQTLAEIARSSAACRDPAAPTWWLGAFLLVLGLCAAGWGLLRLRHESHPQARP